MGSRGTRFLFESQRSRLARDDKFKSALEEQTGNVFQPAELRIVVGRMSAQHTAWVNQVISAVYGPDCEAFLWRTMADGSRKKKQLLQDMRTCCSAST